MLASAFVGLSVPAANDPIPPILPKTTHTTPHHTDLEFAVRLLSYADIQQRVEAPGSQQGRVQQVWPVGGANDEQVLTTPL